MLTLVIAVGGGGNGTTGAFSLFGLILTSCYLDVLLSCLEKGGLKISPCIEWE